MCLFLLFLLFIYLGVGVGVGVDMAYNFVAWSGTLVFYKTLVVIEVEFGFVYW
jgi:hypothetical protein